MPTNTTPFHYYVAFTYQDSLGDSHISAAEVSLVLPVRGMNDVDDITAILARHGFTDAIVLSFSPFADSAPPPAVSMVVRNG